MKIMKTKRILFPIAIAAMTAFCACDRMDYNEYAIYDKDFISLNFGNIGGFMTDLYNAVDYDFGNYSDGAFRGSATDESVFSHAGNGIEDFFNGGWSPANPKSAEWRNMYTAITTANKFLEEFQGLNFDELKLNADYAGQMNRYQNYKYEARFLRAYYYFVLVRQYGGVPLIDHVMPASEANALSRNSSDEIFAFIIKECNEIKDLIIKDYFDLGDLSLGQPENGRANDLAVLALRSRAALYWASPLFNPENDQTRWLTAATYAKELIDAATARGKGLISDYGKLWSSNAVADAANEILFSRRYYKDANGDNIVETNNYPVGIEGGSGGNCPTQNLVEAYDMTNGQPANSSNPLYNAAKPWANLDPRFDLTIAKNGDKWPTYSGAKALEIFQGGVNGAPIVGATTTGYYLKKLCNGAISLAANSKNKVSKHLYLNFRMGEAYLNLAEAMYHLTGSADGVQGSLNISARKAASMTRTRVGMPEIAGNGDAFWQNLQKERQVELAFEGHRFWDVRRWKQGGDFFRTIKLMNITRNADGSFSYKVTTQSREWDEKMNFYPIPQTEIAKNPNLQQNAGW